MSKFVALHDGYERISWFIIIDDELVEAFNERDGLGLIIVGPVGEVEIFVEGLYVLLESLMH